jgi:glucose/arabinose dehydrogenase
MGELAELTSLDRPRQGARRGVIGLTGLLLVSSGALAASAALAQTVPPGFSRTLIASVGSPTALAFTPDGRLLITTQGGTLRVHQDGALLGTPALTIPAGSICANSERGLLGVAVDPEFATNDFIYLYYTFNKFGSCAANVATSPVNRVSRFTLPASNVVSLASEVPLVDNIPSPAGNHNAGDLRFGADGFLYVAAGDGGCQLTNPTLCQNANQNARRLDILSGKILRVNKADGSPVETNPRYGDPGARRCGDPAGVPGGTGPCQEMLLWGLRNPFRFNFRPSSNEFFVNDVGGGTWEEIDEVTAGNGAIGADHGWNLREGHCATGSSSTCSPVNPPAG